MPRRPVTSWRFIDNQGTFELLEPQATSYLYFPLVNQHGMMSSITPDLNGDAKAGQNEFLLMPLSVEDLHNTRSRRNFWVKVGDLAWSLPGDKSPETIENCAHSTRTDSLQAGFLWHTVKCTLQGVDLCAGITNFVPSTEEKVELMRVDLTNTGFDPITFVPTAAIPIYGRSADNLRDHRHVTSLLHRTYCHPFGVYVKPSMSFDERGHTTNQTTYAVLGVDSEGDPPRGFFPLVEEFIGEGGDLAAPQAVLEDDVPLQVAGSVFEGFESLGGLRFPGLTLQPGRSVSYIIILGILGADQTLQHLLDTYGSVDKFEYHLAATKTFWQTRLSALRFDHQDARFDGWLQWVTLQPTLRRVMGNSFLPYHDYGRGGRGWRDLWQDLLALMLTENRSIRTMLIDNFAGVRLDGSNATILGSRPGEFIADRNSIPRVWMDHGAWPLLTIKRYLDLTADLDLLLAEQSYFKDHLTHRCQEVDKDWCPSDGTSLKGASGELWQATLLEHLLVQHLTAFFNVGEHNLLRLEGGDWNDGLDMATARGESVAFSAMYAGNLHTLGQLCKWLLKSGKENVSITSELLMLLDRVSDPLDYDSIISKQTRLRDYLDRIAGGISGKKILLSLRDLGDDLVQKSEWLTTHIRTQEWLPVKNGFGWFNGYYDNEGDRVEGDHPSGVRMTLTGQVFPLMASIATAEQTEMIIRSVDHFLYDQDLNGYHLNTNFGSEPPHLGRAFAFAYGHKENGSAFNHMAVMYAYALYRQGYARQAWRVLNGIYTQSQDFAKSRMYPGIPEYFNPNGRGMYPYLTGSAAWYLFTLLTESFGVKGHLGDLLLEPKLVTEQFTYTDQISVRTQFAERHLVVNYKNPGKHAYGDYQLGKLFVNGVEKPVQKNSSSLCFPRVEVMTWPADVTIDIHLELKG